MPELTVEQIQRLRALDVSAGAHACNADCQPDRERRFAHEPSCSWEGAKLDALIVLPRLLDDLAAQRAEIAALRSKLADALAVAEDLHRGYTALRALLAADRPSESS